MDIFDGLLFCQNGGEETIEYEGRTYYRYMDKLYIPTPPSLLNKSYVAALSEMRLKLGNEVIDLNYSIDVVELLYNELKPEPGDKLIDFGCGGGMLTSFLKERLNQNLPSQILGLDISKFALNEFSKNSLSLKCIEHNAIYFDENSNLEYTDNYFDGAISSFAMHFPIFEHQLGEIYRVLKPSSKFVYNDYVYSKYKGHTKNVVKNLEKVGFEVHFKTQAVKHSTTKDIKHHMFITAIKP